MKLKNILSVICFLLVATACSMEDDIISDAGKEIQNQNSDREAILSFNLETNALLTKSTEDASGDKELKLNNCVLALMDGNDVISVRTSSNIASTGKVNDVTFLTKVRSGLSVIAIVNVANPNAYLNAVTRNDLNKEIAIDPNGTDCLAKQGEKSIEFPAGFGSSSTASTEENTLTVVIVVSQLAAKIQLSEFNIAYATDVQKKKSVTLTSVSFENINKRSYVFTEYALTKDSKAFEMNKPLSEGKNEIGNSIYSYANTNESSPVKMTLTFRIDEVGSMQVETVTKTYIINRSNDNTTFEGEGSGTYVNPGYLYRVNVNMMVNTHSVDTDVICYTQDWEHNEVVVDMSEIK